MCRQVCAGSSCPFPGAVRRGRWRRGTKLCPEVPLPFPYKLRGHSTLRSEIMVNLMTEQEVSKRINVSVASLRRWRLLGRGPAFLKVGSLVRYQPEDLDAWLASLPTGGTANYKQLPSGPSIRQVDFSK